MPQPNTENSVICAVIDGDPRAWVPMADYEALRSRMNRFRTALCAIAGALDELADAEQGDVMRNDESSLPPQP